MHSIYLTKNKVKKADTLLLFFHGWGGDEAMLSHLKKSHQADIMLCMDYRELILSDNRLALIKSYQTIKVIAWSFGVWVAAYICQYYNINVYYAIAYNGTLWPIDDEQGIPKAMAKATLATLDERHLTQFRRRMMASNTEFQRLNESAQYRRPLIILSDELTLLYGYFKNYQTPFNFYQKAIIGINDRIFSAKNQENAWQANNSSVIRTQSSHFCFYNYNRWNHLL
ncbi:MAG: pimeloyl-ACP methyl esterase BioG family protein [Ostreibacterium sp.]